MGGPMNNKFKILAAAFVAAVFLPRGSLQAAQTLPSEYMNTLQQAINATEYLAKAIAGIVPMADT